MIDDIGTTISSSVTTAETAILANLTSYTSKIKTDTDSDVNQDWDIINDLIKDSQDKLELDITG